MGTTGSTVGNNNMAGPYVSRAKSNVDEQEVNVVICA
jgi:hypothetical protein